MKYLDFGRHNVKMQFCKEKIPNAAQMVRFRTYAPRGKTDFFFLIKIFYSVLSPVQYTNCIVTEKTIITKRENNGTKEKQNKTKVNKMAKMTKIKQFILGLGFRVDKVKVLKPIGSLFQW